MIAHAGVVGFLKQQAQQHFLSPYLHWLSIKFTSHLLLVQGSQTRGTRTARSGTFHFMQLTHWFYELWNVAWLGVIIFLLI